MPVFYVLLIRFEATTNQQNNAKIIFIQFADGIGVVHLDLATISYFHFFSFFSFENSIKSSFGCDLHFVSVAA